MLARAFLCVVGGWRGSGGGNVVAGVWWLGGLVAWVVGGRGTQKQRLGIHSPGKAPVYRCWESVVRSKHPDTHAWDPFSDPSTRIQILGIRGPRPRKPSICLQMLGSDQGNQASVNRCLDRSTDPKHLFPDAWIGTRIPSICLRMLGSEYDSKHFPPGARFRQGL